MNRARAEELDAGDPLAAHYARFTLPPGIIYLDGNSLGALPRNVGPRIDRLVSEEWGRDLIQGWNKHGWIGLPQQVGEKIAPLIGAAPGQVVGADSTSINLFKMLVTALALRPGRTEILSQEDNFPTDLYMAQGVSSLVDGVQLRTVAEDALVATLGEQTAVLMLTHVNFRTGSLHDMRQLTEKAHAAGALVLWDLSHSAGAMPLRCDSDGVDMAIGCGYKYLNGGPGAPAYVYLATRHQDRVAQPLAGWMGHRNPFDFAPDYDPAAGILRYLCGTPNILSMAALDAALDNFENVDLERVREKSMALTDYFLELLEPRDLPLALVSPRDAGRRGSQLNFAADQGYAIVQALIAAGVISDFREPNIIRFGFSPLYTRFIDVFDAVERLDDVVSSRIYEKPEFSSRKLVT